MIVVRKPEGFQYTTVRICEHCNTEKASVCLQYNVADLANEKLSPNRFYCEYCYKDDK